MSELAPPVAVPVQNAQTAGWFARFLDAAPGAILTAVLIALFGFLGWITVSLGDLNARVTAVEARLTRLETSVDDLKASVKYIYKLLAERLPPPPEEKQPQR